MVTIVKAIEKPLFQSQPLVVKAILLNSYSWTDVVATGL